MTLPVSGWSPWNSLLNTLPFWVGHKKTTISIVVMTRLLTRWSIFIDYLMIVIILLK